MIFFRVRQVNSLDASMSLNPTNLKDIRRYFQFLSPPEIWDSVFGITANFGANGKVNVNRIVIITIFADVFHI